MNFLIFLSVLLLSVNAAQASTQANCNVDGCRNDGRCLPNGLCLCTALWTGYGCDDPSCYAPNVHCANGGTCQYPGQCSCTAGWRGPLCESAACNEVSCLNGGTCQSDGVCSCQSGWTGDSCESPDTSPTTTNSATGDPHMMVHITGSELPVCFDYNGRDRDTIQMLFDATAGVLVNAQLFAPQGKKRTYFRSMEISTADCDIKASYTTIEANGITVPWDSENEWTDCGEQAAFMVEDQDHLVVIPAEGVEFSLMRKANIEENGDRTEFMNFFMVEYHGLSKETTGLFGQFLNMVVEVSVNPEDEESALISFPLEESRHYVPASLIYKWKLLEKERVSCWLVKNQGQGLIRGNITDYVM